MARSKGLKVDPKVGRVKVYDIVRLTRAPGSQVGPFKAHNGIKWWLLMTKFLKVDLLFCLTRPITRTMINPRYTPLSFCSEGCPTKIDADEVSDEEEREAC